MKLKNTEKNKRFSIFSHYVYVNVLVQKTYSETQKLRRLFQWIYGQKLWEVNVIINQEEENLWETVLAVLPSVLPRRISEKVAVLRQRRLSSFLKTSPANIRVKNSQQFCFIVWMLKQEWNRRFSSICQVIFEEPLFLPAENRTWTHSMLMEAQPSAMQSVSLIDTSEISAWKTRNHFGDPTFNGRNFGGLETWWRQRHFGSEWFDKLFWSIKRQLAASSDFTLWTLNSNLNQVKLSIQVNSPLEENKQVNSTFVKTHTKRQG